MSLSDQTLTALQTLMAQDSALLAQVQGAEETAQAVSYIAQAAAQKGITVSAAELSAYFETRRQGASTQALSDEQLEAVAGGVSDTDKLILLSVFTLGLGCIAFSAGQAVGHPDNPELIGIKQKFC
ncbi:hypothetical protein MIZ03_0416 [Rhodoferax lithotrophicus]|uniref:Nif11 domain-containing protein n=1 Tax=Rhodoferax lithotrophicus TaxID=2798804 RepID=A0ABM7MH60_9BURK|nr:hypothetical protein [Rhodoferax sp. MIZ03]BCO25555.1 hypothetical protein MIZ03_0416 [Rhodoferax sp. MIZ03]